MTGEIHWGFHSLECQKNREQRAMVCWIWRPLHSLQQQRSIRAGRKCISGKRGQETTCCFGCTPFLSFALLLGVVVFSACFSHMSSPLGCIHQNVLIHLLSLHTRLPLATCSHPPYTMPASAIPLGRSTVVVMSWYWCHVAAAAAPLFVAFRPCGGGGGSTAPGGAVVAAIDDEGPAQALLLAATAVGAADAGAGQEEEEEEESSSSCWPASSSPSVSLLPLSAPPADEDGAGSARRRDDAWVWGSCSRRGRARSPIPSACSL